MLEHGNTYSGRVLKRSVSPVDQAVNAGEAPSLADNPELSPQEIREMVLAQAQRDADELRKQRMAELDQEIERAVASHIMSATRELNLSMVNASGDIAQIVETALRRITGEMSDQKLLNGIIKQAVKERNAESAAIVSVAPNDYPKVQLILMGDPKYKKGKWIELVADETLSPGRVIMSINGKQFDISLDTQISAIRAALRLDPSSMEEGTLA